MGIDKTSIVTGSIVIDDNETYLNQLRKSSEIEGYNEQDIDKLLISSSDNEHTFKMCEYYYEEETNNIVISGVFKNSKNETYIGLNIPLSNEVLIDILTHSIKKLNKMKNVLESLK